MDTGTIVAMTSDPNIIGSKTTRRIVNSKASAPNLKLYKDGKYQTVDSRLANKFSVDPSGLLLVGSSPKRRLYGETIEERRKSVEAPHTMEALNDAALFQKVVLTPANNTLNYVNIPYHYQNRKRLCHQAKC